MQFIKISSYQPKKKNIIPCITEPKKQHVENTSNHQRVKLILKKYLFLSKRSDDSESVNLSQNDRLVFVFIVALN